MSRVAVIGAGISGMTVAHLLKDRADVTVFEKEGVPGGLIKCEKIEGSLFHTCGGHVFNTKREDVLHLFWSFFNRDRDFIKAERNSAVFFDSRKIVPYPIENHLYEFDDDIVGKVIDDLLKMDENGAKSDNFEDFLKNRFGDTLYELYFKPYNSKIWKSGLADVPLEWLDGKLPMPTPKEIIFNNIKKVKEKKFVHSSFWYEKRNGSQFLADQLSEGIDIRYDSCVGNIEKRDSKWAISGELFDKVVFCGDIRDLPAMLESEFPEEYRDTILRLRSHGTTSVFCEIEENPYSWIYLPNNKYSAHRIICTGNFSGENNASGKMTGTVEFTDAITTEEILRQLKDIPLSPRYITHKYNPCTYPIQDNNTRAVIRLIKNLLSVKNFYFTGRFADWEYYNMDVAMGAAMDTVENYGL